MSPTSPLQDPHIETRNKLDEDISRLESQLISLKLARNALAPITRLHCEILQEIFFLTHYTSPHRGKATLLITWISHGWRELAHNTAALWSHIDFKRPEWVEVAISRTKNRALEFVLLNIIRRTTRPTKPDFSPLISLSLGNLSRISVLNITSRYGRNEMSIPVTTPEWLIPAPLLVDLRLRGLTLPPNIFSGTTPRLRCLDLQLCGLDWDTLPIPPGLTSLTLSHPIILPNLDRLIKILQMTRPTLEELELRNVLYQDENGPRTLCIDSILLDKLTSIKLEEDDSKGIAFMLGLLTLPPRIMMEVSMAEWLESNVLQALVTCRNVEKWPMNHLEIRVEDNSVILRIIEEWSKATGGLIAPDQQSDIQSEVRIEIAAIDSLSTFLPAFTTLPIQPIERVSFVGGYHQAQNPTILDYIGNLGTVRELHIKLPYLTTFLTSTGEQNDKLTDGLEEDLSNPDAAKEAQMVISFHNLRDFEIHGDPGDSPGFTREDALILQTWLRWRNRLGLRLERLRLSELNIPPIHWLSNTFDGFVNTFETLDVKEGVEEIYDGAD